MTTWAEVQAHVRARYELETDTAEGFALVLTYEDGRRKRVEVRRFESFEIDWLEFRSEVCPANRLDATAALKRNHTMACGALALNDEDGYVLLYTAPLPTMDTEELELPLFVVAADAARIESELTRADP